MQVFLVHAADAEPHARALAERLRWHDCQPTQIWSSPADGAPLTAAMIAGVIDADAEVVTAPDLAALAAIIQALDELAVVLVVGAEPALSALASALDVTPARPLAAGEAIRIVDGAIRWRVAWNADATTPRG